MFLLARAEAHFTLSNLESVYDASDVFDGAVAEIGTSLAWPRSIDSSALWTAAPRGKRFHCAAGAGAHLQ